MPSFGRRNPGYGYGGPRYPGTFLLAVQEALARLQWQAVHWLGHGIECVDAQASTRYVGLENLYRRLRREPRATWPALLVDLLSSVTTEATQLPGDLSEVEGRLLIRLGPYFKQENPETDVWNHPLVPHRLVATLVIDYPQSMSYVTEKMVDDSTQDGGDWMEQALANLRALSPADGMVMVHEETGLWQAQFSDAYDSSRALILDDLLPGHEQFGFFVAVPARDHLLVLPISEKTLSLAAWLRACAASTYRDVPYPISPELYWVRAGDWQHFPIDSDGETVRVNPPPAFAEVIAQLHLDEATDPSSSEDDSDSLSD